MNDDPTEDLNNDPRFNRQEVEHARRELVLNKFKGLLKSEEATQTKFDQAVAGQEYIQTSLEVNSMGNDALSRINLGKLTINYVPATSYSAGGEVVENHLTLPEILTADIYGRDLTLVNKYTLSRDQEGNPFIAVGDEGLDNPVHPATQAEELELQSVIEAARTMVTPSADNE